MDLVTPWEDWCYQGSDYVGSEEMICIGMSNNCLQQKMKLVNIQICENCIKESNSYIEKIIYDGAFLECPLPVDGSLSTRLNLAEEEYLPKDCKYIFEHTVLGQRNVT